MPKVLDLRNQSVNALYNFPDLKNRKQNPKLLNDQTFFRIISKSPKLDGKNWQTYVLYFAFDHLRKPHKSDQNNKNQRAGGANGQPHWKVHLFFFWMPFPATMNKMSKPCQKMQLGKKQECKSLEFGHEPRRQFNWFELFKSSHSIF